MRVMLHVRIRAADTWFMIKNRTNSIDSSELHQAIVVSLATLLFTYLVVWSIRTKAESAVDYTVEEPEQLKPGWKGKVLDSPSIQVGITSLRRIVC